MGEVTRKEFQQLYEYSVELNSNLDNKKVMRAHHLVIIRNHIQDCDYLAETRLEMHILFMTFDSWEKCLKFYLRFRPNTENVDIPELKLKTVKQVQKKEEIKNTKAFIRVERPSTNPRKSWEEMLTASGKRLLKSLRISPDNKMHGPDDEPDNEQDEDGYTN